MILWSVDWALTESLAASCSSFFLAASRLWPRLPSATLEASGSLTLSVEVVNNSAFL